jgi:hypothetical protein
LGDGVHDDRASAEDLAALRAAVLQWHEELVGTLPGPRSVRVVDGLQRLHLSWLVLPWIVVDAGRMFLSGLRRGFPVHDEQAVGLYRRLSGKDPQVARAEIWRIVMQLGELDERLRDPDEQRPEAPRGADPGELEAAAGALLGFYLAGRRTDDELLAQVEAAWAESEELTEQLVERSRDRKRVGRSRADPTVEERVQVAADRYLVAWRRWFEGQARQGATRGSGDRWCGFAVEGATSGERDPGQFNLTLQ